MSKAQADTFFKAQDYVKAIEEYSRCIDATDFQDDVLPTLHSNRAACYLHINKLNEAHEDALACTRLKPTWAKGFMRLGSCLARQGKVDEGVHAYEKALALDPNNAEIKKALSQLQQSQPSQQQFNQFATSPILDTLKAKVLELVSKTVAWFTNLSDQEKMYGAALIALFGIYYFFFRQPAYSDVYSDNNYASGGYGSYGMGGGGLSWTSWAAIMMAAYRLPPMFPQVFGEYARPFFGMSWTTFMWLLDMVTRNNRGGFGNRFQRRRGFF